MKIPGRVFGNVLPSMIINGKNCLKFSHTDLRPNSPQTALEGLIAGEWNHINILKRLCLSCHTWCKNDDWNAISNFRGNKNLPCSRNIRLDFNDSWCSPSSQSQRWKSQMTRWPPSCQVENLSASRPPIAHQDAVGLMHFTIGCKLKGTVWLMGL